MFTQSAQIYDLIYSFKDYAEESRAVANLIRAHSKASGDALLDVGCGTGRHLHYLSREFSSEGIDLDANLLSIARERCPEVVFHNADMAEFDLWRRFDAIVCLFGSVGYVKTVPRLNRTLTMFARHLKPGGVVLLEPWLTPDRWIDGMPIMQTAQAPGIRACRMNVSHKEEGPENLQSPIEFFYQVATEEGVTHFQERHELGLFTIEQYRHAFELARLTPVYDKEGLTGRGLWIAVRTPGRVPDESQSPSLASIDNGKLLRKVQRPHASLRKASLPARRIVRSEKSAK